MAGRSPRAALARLRRGGVYRGDKALAGARRHARSATARARLRPSYLVIGAQKAGTTSLHRYLAEHPAVLTGAVKEIEYFNRTYAEGEGSYRARFPLVTRAVSVRARTGVWPAVGEATAAYLFDPRVPQRVHAFDPRMKLLAVLRDPVDRAYSHYQMELRWQRETLPFAEALERESSEVARELDYIHEHPLARGGGFACSYVARGRYAEQLERWLRFFPRDQLLVLTSDELLDRPAETMTEVSRFLGIPDRRLRAYPREGVREYEPLPPDVRAALAATFEPENRRLEQLLGRTLPWTRSETARAPLG